MEINDFTNHEYIFLYVHIHYIYTLHKHISGFCNYKIFYYQEVILTMKLIPKI